MSEQEPGTAPKRESMSLNIIFNIVFPSLLLMKGKAWLGWDPATVLVVALILPCAYFFYDLRARGKRNFISIIGFVSILITGGVGLLQLDKDWIAIKEAAVPLLFGIAVLVSLKTRYPLVRTFLYNPEIFDVPLIEAELEKRDAHSGFERLLVRCTILLAFSFLLSAILNFILATIIVQSDSGTDAFNEELGRLMAWSWPVIVIPTMCVTIYALYVLVKGIERHTGLKMEQVLINAQQQPSGNSAPEA